MNPADFGALWEALNYHLLPVDMLELTEMAAYAILRAGTIEQRSTFLAPIRTGKLLVALGYSEPDAGSDVAAAKTTATRDGNGWVVNGAKIFTTGAHVSDYVLLLTRTNPDAPKHRGLTLFLVSLRDPGVEIQPIYTFGGERTNAVFYDDVTVSDDARIGEVDQGWAVLNVALDFERTLMGSFVGQAQRLLDDLLEAVGDGSLGSAERARIAQLNVRIEAARGLADHVYRLALAGQAFTVEAAMTKLTVTEAFKDLAYLALDVIGPPALVSGHDTGAPVRGRLEHWFRHSQIATIYGGSNEIQRNIIAGRGLGLPRG
jgi:alkylation response protein AidB-like acyl-CoA dehydrogenase